ncbi:MAG: diacylglycerol/lipid kinase family protein [Bacillota bacterium]|jgi:diacylglycerol kinase (ATP)
MKNAMVIINPCAGKQQSKNKLFDLVNIFFRHGYEVTVFPTQGKNDATNIVKKNMSKYDLVICCGGDGTLNEVISGMMMHQKRPPLGFIPVGTTNDLATSLKIPKNMLKAAETIIEGKLFPYDIGMFNQKLYFDYVAAFGIFSDVPYNTSQQLKTSLGHLAYVLEGMKTFTKLPSYHMKIEYDGHIIEDDFTFGAITNSLSMGGLVKYKQKYVQLNDGLFEMLLVKSPRNTLHLSSIITDLLRQQYDKDDVLLLHAAKINITSEQEVSWCLDGESGGWQKEVQIINQPRSINFLVGQDAKGDINNEKETASHNRLDSNTDFELFCSDISLKWY